MTWPALIRNPQSRQRLKRHLLFWLVAYTCLTIGLSTSYISFAVNFHSIRIPLTLLALTLLVFLPYQVGFVYVGLYWVLPPALVHRYGLCLRRFLIYVGAAWITNYLIRFFILVPLRTGKPAMFSTYHSALPLAALYTMMVITATAVGIKLFRFWYQRTEANQQLVRQTLLIELQVLKAQIHPHFLFNTLNNLYSLILTQSPLASNMVLKLSELLHYMIHECSVPWVPLEKEIEFIQNYIELEKLRYGPRLTVTMDISGETSTTFIAPLLLITFVENAFKHGAARQVDATYIHARLAVHDNTLWFRLENSRSEPFSHTLQPNGGLGLMNLRKRLALLYPNGYELTVLPKPNQFSIELSLTLQGEPTQLHSSLN